MHRGGREGDVGESWWLGWSKGGAGFLPQRGGRELKALCDKEFQAARSSSRKKFQVNLEQSTEQRKTFAQWSGALTIFSLLVVILSVTAVSDPGPYHWPICLALGLAGVACGIKGKSPLWTSLAELSAAFLRSWQGRG